MSQINDFGSRIDTSVDATILTTVLVLQFVYFTQCRSIIHCPQEYPEFRANQNISMLLRIRDTNSCQQDRTHPFAHSKRSHKSDVSVSKAQTQKKKNEDTPTNRLIQQERDNKKDGRRDETCREPLCYRQYAMQRCNGASRQ